MAAEPVPALLSGAVEMVSVTAVTPHPRNARRGDVEAVAASIRHNGWWGACVAQRSSSHVIVGSHRLLAARLVGLDEIPVMWVDVDDVTAECIMIADNRYAEIAAWDDAALLVLLDGLDDLEGSGFEPIDVEALRALLDGQQSDESAGEARLPAAEVRCQVGPWAWTMSREAWNGFEADVVAEAGSARHEDCVQALRARLGA